VVGIKEIGTCYIPIPDKQFFGAHNCGNWALFYVLTSGNDKWLVVQPTVLDLLQV
jgi:hypothetical protein